VSEEDGAVRLASAQGSDEGGKDKQPKQLIELLQVPVEIPGAKVADIVLPPPTEPREKYEAAINQHFPPLPVLPKEEQAVPGPEGRPLTLADLQQLALTNSPVLRQAVADVEAARGTAIQAGLPPNPTLGYEGDTIGQNNSAGLQGAYVEQLIKTGGKLRLAQAAALIDLRNGELKLRETQVQIQTQVRAGYFNVLAARESLKITAALARLSDHLYQLLLVQLKARVVSPHEVMQLRVLALQARGLVVQAGNRYSTAWRQLAAGMGMPALPLTELAGSADRAVPSFQRDDVLERVLSRHTELLAAENAVIKARHLARLAQLAPLPDVDLRVLLQRDHTTPPFGVVPSVQIGMPVPVWNRNQGGILQAQAQLARAVEERGRVRADLSARVAEAFERYDNNRRQLELYRTQVLPHQVLAYRGLVQRYARLPDPEKAGVNYNDVVAAEQNLAAAAMTYLDLLRNQWTAVVDLAGLLQSDDLFRP
jgi:cobalt-zinc-cadmium efflux system outer membrane protein